MKRRMVIVLLFVILLFPLSSVQATYVLPYPSYMPGNKLYSVSRLVDTLKKYWSWGTIAKTQYQLALSDKYLVEAKTLFEYHQYLLASAALQRSNGAFSMLPPMVVKGKQEGKDMTALKNTISEAAVEHIRVLELMKVSLPTSVTWSPEKAQSTELLLHDMMQTSLDLRASTITKLQSL